ncbi:unnamed protein product [Calypogeia fissa]
MTNNSQTRNETEGEIAAKTRVEGEIEHEYAQELEKIEHEDAPELATILEVAHPPIVDPEPIPMRVSIDALSVEDGEPSTYAEAMTSSEKSEWTQAMHKEMKSLHDNKTWELVDLPKDKQIMDSKRVYKKKDDATE